MIENEDGRVSGSIDRARVAELLAGTDDAELQAYYRDLLGESAEGKAVDEPAEADQAAAEPETDDTDEAAAAVELDELRAQAEAAGVKVDGRWGADRLREEIAANDGKGGGEV